MTDFKQIATSISMNLWNAIVQAGPEVFGDSFYDANAYTVPELFTGKGGYPSSRTVVVKQEINITTCVFTLMIVGDDNQVTISSGVDRKGQGSLYSKTFNRYGDIDSWMETAFDFIYGLCDNDSDRQAISMISASYELSRGGQNVQEH